MEAPKIKVGNKTYSAIRPKTKLWRELIRYKTKYGDVESVMSEPDKHMEQVDDLFKIMADALPDDVTADMLEEETYLDDFIRFAGRTMAYIEVVVMGKSEQLPAKN